MSNIIQQLEAEQMSRESPSFIPVIPSSCRYG